MKANMKPQSGMCASAAVMTAGQSPTGGIRSDPTPSAMAAVN